MKQLVSGNADLDLVGTGRKDKIGEIFKALLVLCGATLVKARIEEQSEQTRFQAELDQTTK